MKATFQEAWGYQGNNMNLPVVDVDQAVSFYENMMGFQVVSREDTPDKSLTLGRDEVQIRLAENGADASQDGCFFQVDNVEAAFAEFKTNGLEKEASDSFSIENYGDTSYKVFFVIAPDGLCYCIGELIPRE
jgi:catechol 2,3-dioxygenase-like lactoylglutathione lyase family enzyme